MKNDRTEPKSKRRSPAIPPAIGAACLELSGNRELLIEGSKGVLEYTPETVRVNTSDMIVSVSGRGLDLRCISSSALIIDGFILNIEFSV